ncbi:hypothetical protein F5051DRAFT_446383 [Lentinula edodes]|nr:hypothetical protein F5051DRAFT_446383 [Lentinula edodes]
MGLTQYKATKKRPFCMRMAIPPKKMKGQCSDVESTLEYIAQAAKIIKSKTNATVFMWIDGKEILESCRKLMCNSAGSDNNENGDEFDDDDKELARIRIILEKQHGNDYNLIYTYIDPTTTKKFALSLNAINEWTRAIYSGLADKFRPPSNDDSPNFAVNPGEKSDLVHFATIMSMIVPSCPMQSPIPSSSCEKHSNQTPLFSWNKGYGPNILECVEDKDLVDLGIKHGDAMHLKRAAPIWFNRPEAKQK